MGQSMLSPVNTFGSQVIQTVDGTRSTRGSHTEKQLLDVIQQSFDLKILDLQALNDFVRRTTREKKFCIKVQKMVKDVECGSKIDGLQGNLSQPSLADCWRWLKGLLFDFINMKKQSGR